MITILLIFFLFLSVISDIRTYQVKNRLILVAAVCAICYRIIPLQWTSIYEGIIGFLFPFILLFPLFLIGGIGAADIKVFMVTGIVYGWKANFHIIILSFIIGGVISLLYTIVSKNSFIGLIIFYEYGKNCMGHIYRKQIHSLISYSNYRKIYCANHCISEYRNTIHFTIPIFIAVLYYKYLA